MRAYQAKIEGLVQGVGFRWSAVNEARRLGVHGWIRNEADGSVSARFEGEDASVAAFREWLGKGPPGATVRDATFSPVAPSGLFRSFVVE